jgi:acetolactate synthase-1/2/3 large subunit
MKRATGGRVLCSTLERLGVEHIFGLPGTQNISLFEALRQSSLRTILATNELAAGFMANGYYRASGKVGVLTTIPGPGFAWAVAAIAEASQDSAALLYLVNKPAGGPGAKFNLQAIDQRAILAPLVRRVIEVDQAVDISAGVREAFAATTAGEPGPVLLQIDERAINGDTVETAPPADASPAPTPADLIQQAAQLLRDSGRAVFFVGQGANDANRSLRELAERLGAPVVATRSARGIVPEDHPLAMTFDFSEAGVRGLNALLDRSDLIVAIGCKLSHNGTYGFKLRFAKEKLIHVDASAEVLGANYPAQLAIQSDAGAFLDALAKADAVWQSRQSDWSLEELAARKHSGATDPRVAEPKVQGVNPPTPGSFFAALRAALPSGSCLVTDSGLHQVLATRHFRVQEPRGMIIPSDFQSMGFGLPAAIGAKLAAPHRAVVALIGDGGLAMSGMELVTAVRERIPLTVIVFNDGALGQIRLQQLSSYGHSHATELRTPNLALFAEAIGAKYLHLGGDAVETLRCAVTGDAVTLVEVNVGDSVAFHKVRAKGLARQTARGVLNPAMLEWIKSKLRRRGPSGSVGHSRLKQADRIVQ